MRSGGPAAMTLAIAPPMSGLPGSSTSTVKLVPPRSVKLCTKATARASA